MSWQNPLNPSFELEFEDLYQQQGLVKLNQKFEEFLWQKNPQIAEKLLVLKNNNPDVLIDGARVLEDFIVKLFNIEKENNLLKKQHEDLQKIYHVKKEFVQRFVAKNFSSVLFLDSPLPINEVSVDSSFLNHEVIRESRAFSLDAYKILQELKIDFSDIDDLEKKLAQEIFLLLESDVVNLWDADFKIPSNDCLSSYSSCHLERSERSLEFYHKEISHCVRDDSLSMSQNESMNFDKIVLYRFKQLISYTTWALYSNEGKAFHKDGSLFILPKKIDLQNLIREEENQLHKKNRDGFNLTDQGFSLNRVLSETHYCIFCHKQKKDSCRSGIHEKNGEIKIDPLNVKLGGCPLDQKISEMNLLKSENFSLASLAIAIIDNPMIAGTGHRICNDCMKACIYQKQDAVDIPQIETRILKDVLKLPYGFEIYSLLTRWNPLNIESKFPKVNSGKKVLVCGLGPAGYTLSHYLLNEGHSVVAIDGLKIEPLNPIISGVDLDGNFVKFKPIKFLEEIYQPLSGRLIQGFGGVAEYGITSRWDKNFLTIIRLLLERRQNFRMFGGLRFGSSITEKIAFEKYGFNHIAICVGAGKPNIINLENNFAKGIRSASDFLMSLQLNGAFRKDLQTNLQIRMPIIVIGGGLTAVDTACEAGIYYIEQIKKFAKNVEKIGKENLFKSLNIEEKNIAEEFLNHHQKYLQATSNVEFLKSLGGVKILYRKKTQDAPAYRLNHQELNKALQEGIEFIENVTPIKAELDDFGYIKSLRCDVGFFDCKSLLIAAGTSPNLSAFTEDEMDVNNENISFFGDATEKFEGNVVKAMMSAKMGYKKISDKILTPHRLSFASSTPTQGGSNHSELITHPLRGSRRSEAESVGGLEDFLVRIEKIERLSNNVVEIFVKAPLIASQTEVGHIFRLQNYHALAAKDGDKILAMEGVAVTALSVDKVNGIISGIVVETGGSTSLIKNFRIGESCVFMGPSGKPTEIPKNETVLFIGGGRGNQPLTALAEVFKSNNCRVIFIAGYKKSEFIVRQERMENSCDKMIFAIEEDCNLDLKKPSSLKIKGSVIDVIKKYFTNYPEKIDRIFTIGNDEMMHEIAKIRHQNLIPAISNAPIAITSLNAPMQCMLKGVCSQCLQKRIGENGEIEYFYSCASQDQDMDKFDFEHLHARCQQNSLLEKVVKFDLK